MKNTVNCFLVQNELEDKKNSVKKNFDLYIKPTKNQKHDTDLLYIGLYFADDSTADPQYFCLIAGNVLLKHCNRLK